MPSEKQKEIIQHKRHLLFETFKEMDFISVTQHVVGKTGLRKSSIVPVSIDYYQNKFRLYNFERLMEVIFLKLTGYKEYLSRPLFDLDAFNNKRTAIVEQYGEALCKQIYQEDKDYVPLKKEEPESSSHSSSSSSSSSLSVKRRWFY